jgi:hypothetical protein
MREGRSLNGKTHRERRALRTGWRRNRISSADYGFGTARGHVARSGLPGLIILTLTPAVARPNGGAASPQRALLDRYRVTCHNQRLRTAGLALDTIAVDNVAAGPSTWEKVVRKIRAGADATTLQAAAREDDSRLFASWLETALDSAAAAKPYPGRVVVHRLNQAEYANGIQDLLGL